MIDFLLEANKKKDEILRDIAQLCQIPSVLDPTTATTGAPFGVACREALDCMLEIGKRDGFECDNVDGYAGHIDIGTGKETLGILGHLDVVPVNHEGWSTPPFEMVEKDGILYGRGVADDKGPLIAAYYAAKIVNELLPNPKLKMRIIFGCDEENGSSCMKYYFTKQPFPDMGFTPDADFPVVYGEKALAHYHLRGDIPQDNIIGIYGGVAANVVSEHCEAYVQGSYKQYKETFKAYLEEHGLNGSIEEEGNHTKFNIIGKAAHASTPDEGISAIVYLCHYLATISSNELVKFIDQYFYKDTHGKKLELMERGQMGVTTTNIGILHYKDGYVNSVVDFRLPHELSETELNSAISHAVQPLGLEIDYNYTPALFNDPKGEYIQTLHQAYVDLTGDTENQPQAIGGGTYAKTMPNCVAFGCQFPGKDHKMHQNDEEISIDDLIKACAIYAKAIYDLNQI